MTVDAPIITEPRIVNALYWDYRSSALCMAPHFTPHGWYECDVMLITSAGFMVEFEIKTSVRDFRADAHKKSTKYIQPGDPGAPYDGRWTRIDTRKHDRLAAADPRGPSRFFFVVPDGMIGPEQVPSWAGLIIAQPATRTRTILRSIKAAPKLHKQKCDAEKIDTLVKNRIYHRFWQIRTG